MLSVCALTGCVGFRVPPLADVVRDTSDRTRQLSNGVARGLPRNRAAMLTGRSQAEIKPQIESLWRPSWRPLAWPNYNGFFATLQSQFESKPGPIFHSGKLAVPHLGRDTTVNYIAAFHRGRRLPLVIGVSGINGTVDGKVTIDVLENLYKSGEFHVIHLESLTSVAHQVRNDTPFMGGFPEGLLLYEVMDELRNRSEYADGISQIHLLGVSFGGLLCGIAAHCEDEFQAGVLDGAVLAFSPPLDLKELFHNLGDVPLIHDRVHQTYLVDGLQQLAKRSDIDLPGHDASKLDFDDCMRQVVFPRLQKEYPALKADFPDLPPIRTADDAYAVSSMRPFFARLGVPYFTVVAYDDPVVSPEDHFHKVLIDCPNPLVDGMLLGDGGHLGFDAVCGFPFMSRAAERYFKYWSVAPKPHSRARP